MALTGSRSTFPTTVDSANLTEYKDLSPSEVVAANRWNTLKLQASKTSDEIVEFNTLTAQLAPKIFSPESLNTLSDCIINLENFFLNSTVGYIQTKQNEFQAEINKFTNCGIYNPLTQYYTKNFVDYNGEVFLCLTNSMGNTPNPSATTTYWKKLSIKGDTGYGVGLSPKDDYSASTTYYVNDLVQYNGNLYRCILQSVGNYPTNTTYFKLFLAGNGETYANLTTDAKGSLVSAINEVDAHTDTALLNASSANTNIGTLGGLSTTAKSNLVVAINEVISNLSSEVTNRTNSDATLQTNITNEATARNNADALKANIASPNLTGSPTISSNIIYHAGNITASATAPVSALTEGYQHQVYV